MITPVDRLYYLDLNKLFDVYTDASKYQMSTAIIKMDTLLRTVDSSGGCSNGSCCSGVFR